MKAAKVILSEFVFGFLYACRYCGFTGTQMLCGGGGLPESGLPPAVSLYCSLPYEESNKDCGEQDRDIVIDR